MIVLALMSCATGPRASSSAKLVEGVPFYAQERYQCGPASLAGVLNFWGADVTPAEIADNIYSPTAKGTLDIDILIYARKSGFEARQFRGSISEVKASIDAGYPLIVFVDLGISLYRQGHFMVVVGYTEEGFIVNSGRQEREYLPIDRFMRTWKKTDFWTLLIKPS